MEIIGKIKWIDETKEYGTKGFRKREVVITTEEQYPQNILVEFVQDKCDLLNAFQIGKQAKVSINLRGREWTNPEGQVKYFNSIQGWRIEEINEELNKEMPPMPPPTTFENAEGDDNEVEDDLPF
jgi:translation initiation factor IF-3